MRVFMSPGSTHHTRTAGSSAANTRLHCSKAAFEQWSKVLANEEPAIRVWWVDPGDMNTQMHQEAFPGEDISDRQPPEAVAPSLLVLIDHDPPSGRYQAAQFLVPA